MVPRYLIYSLDDKLDDVFEVPIVEKRIKICGVMDINMHNIKITQAIKVISPR